MKKSNLPQATDVSPHDKVMSTKPRASFAVPVLALGAAICLAVALYFIFIKAPVQ
jgi:hypothetical protein